MLISVRWSTWRATSDACVSANWTAPWPKRRLTSLEIIEELIKMAAVLGTSETGTLTPKQKLALADLESARGNVRDEIGTETPED